MKNVIKIMAITAILCATAWACSSGKLGAGIKESNLDTNVRPADDFYDFACGGWMTENPLPPSYSRYGSFDQLQENNDKRINDILTELLEGSYEAGTVEYKLSNLYKLAMDSVRRDSDGAAPLMPLISEIEAAETTDDLINIRLAMMPYAGGQFFNAILGADERNAAMNILNVWQGGITLGQKEYYIDTDSATTAIREAYKEHVAKMFTLFGFDETTAQKKMANVLKIETALAKVSKNSTELRDVEANYNKVTLDEFDKAYPNIRLEQLMNAKGIASEHIQELIVGQPAFFTGLDKVMATITADEYRDYMEWGIITANAPYLSSDIVAEDFNFFGRTLRGRQEDYPLWKRATSQVQGNMGEALGKIYADKFFPASSKERMTELVKNLQTALGERIAEQTWMSDSTKANAMEKLATFYVKIGYPDKWTDFTDLNIDPEKSYYENIRECHRFKNADNIARKAGQPVDRDEWYMYPQTVNAYYNPTTNEICFPAGILQPPFFDPAADDAFNYGAIGVVIGHEMTHGFDDQGRHYDKDGNMCDWWTEDDAKQFNERAEGYAQFYSDINVLPDLKANGHFTLGENLADHGGLQVAYHAFKNAQAADSTTTAESNYTPDQRFFIAYAGVWANNTTEEEIRNRTKSDPHSLGRWRVNGAVRHIDAWYDAFGITENDPMFLPKEQRLDLW